MTATTITRAGSIPETAHVSFLGELRSELIKVTAIRSTPWILVTTVVVMVGIAALGAWGSSMVVSNPEMGGGDIVADPSIGLGAVTGGLFFGQIVVAILGALNITGEYSTGQIRSTIAAVPRRLPVLAAKGVVVTLAALATGAVSVALGVLVTTPILSGQGVAPDLGADGALQQLAGVPLYLAAVALTSLGIGAMLRNTAGAIAVAVVIFFILPIVWPSIQLDFFQDTADYLPSLAGQRLVGGEQADAIFTPWQGYGVMLGWAALSLLGGAILLKKRDA